MRSQGCVSVHFYGKDNYVAVCCSHQCGAVLCVGVLNLSRNKLNGVLTKDIQNLTSLSEYRFCGKAIHLTRYLTPICGLTATLNLQENLFGGLVPSELSAIAGLGMCKTPLFSNDCCIIVHISHTNRLALSRTSRTIQQPLYGTNPDGAWKNDDLE